MMRGLIAKIFVRCLHLDTVALVRNHNPKIRAPRFSVPMNPGINESLDVLEYNSKDDITEEDLQELNELETDFMNVHDLERHHQSDIEKGKDILRKKIVKTKYFKEEKVPKLLTWEEKEQIYNLHKLDPEQWTPKKLSECFPATEYVVKKILKSTWKPASIEKILQYNKGVAANWKLLRLGKLNINEETRMHLTRFTSRKMMISNSPDAATLPAPIAPQTTESTEFCDIIKSYNRTKRQETNSHSIKQIAKDDRSMSDEDTFVMNDRKRQNTVHVTLDKYSENILKLRREFDAVDKAIVDRYADKMANNDQSEDTLTVDATKFNESLEVHSASKVLPEKISIPRHLKSKGSLFKFEDCYYDVDGEFLYRVPGMTN